MKHSIAQALIRRHHGRIMPFRELPQAAQLAMSHYMAVDGEAWQPSKFFADKAFRHPSNYGWYMRLFKSDLDHYIQKYGRRRFGLVEIPMVDMVTAVMGSSLELQKEFGDFDAYHDWYLRNNSIPDHGDSRWPVILASEQSEESLLQDGWHRFHSYYRDGVKAVPSLFYP